jgi:quercetin dioxygenase-like cupin family protein
MSTSTTRSGTAWDGAVVTRADEGEALVVVRDRVIAKGRAAGFVLAEVEVPPGAGTPRHAHPGPEMIRVLEGELEFALGEGGDLVALRPGDTVSIPGMTPHSYRNAGPGAVRMLAFFDEGLEAFFRAVGTPGSEVPAGPPGPEEMARVAQAAATHGLTILGPHPGRTAAA